MTLVIALLLACPPSAPTEPVAPANPPPESVAPVPLPTVPAAAGATPPTEDAPADPGAPGARSAGRELYESCRDRVELPQADGECTVDADCARTGCGSESCITAKAAVGFISTCEALPCFQALDSCGCRAGRCEWTIFDSPPPRRALVPN